MTAPLVHITERGFSPDPWQDRIVLTLATRDQAAAGENTVLKLDGTSQVEDIADDLAQIAAISISFPSFQDGRGFSLARKLRALGYTGGLRAEGGLHVDQFRHALHSGFDAVAITEDLAERMPEAEWKRAAAEALPSYQARFMTLQDSPDQG